MKRVKAEGLKGNEKEKKNKTVKDSKKEKKQALTFTAYVTSELHDKAKP